MRVSPFGGGSTFGVTNIKSKQEFRDGCKWSGDALIINGSRYTVNDVHKLPTKIAAYKSAEKSNKQYLAFHGGVEPIQQFPSQSI